MLQAPSFAAFNILYLKFSCFYCLSFLRYLQFLNPTSQILSNFHIKLGKIELLITFDGEIISTSNL